MPEVPDLKHYLKRISSAASFEPAPRLAMIDAWVSNQDDLEIFADNGNTQCLELTPEGGFIIKRTGLYSFETPYHEYSESISAPWTEAPGGPNGVGGQIGLQLAYRPVDGDPGYSAPLIDYGVTLTSEQISAKIVQIGGNTIQGGNRLIHAGSEFRLQGRGVSPYDTMKMEVFVFPMLFLD